MGERVNEFDQTLEGLANAHERTLIQLKKADRLVIVSANLALCGSVQTPEDLDKVWGGKQETVASDWSHGVHAAGKVVLERICGRWEEVVCGEYEQREVFGQDLGADTPEQRQERAGLIALASMPGSEADFDKRSRAIHDLLDRVAGGQPIDVDRLTGNWQYPATPPISADLDRELFVVLKQGASVQMIVNYDRPDPYSIGPDSTPTQQLLNIPLDPLFGVQREMK